jgi:hypothetical protein
VTSTTVAPADASFAVRAWRAPLGAHAAALALVLLALLPFLGSSRLFSADEGALVAQAHVLADGKGWFIDHPRPDLDPDGRFFLLHLSTAGDDASAPFAKHPVYAGALAPLEALGGKPAMVLMSLAGTVLAALVAALLARRIRPGTERYAFWAVGLASPAFLYGYVLIAHTVGAALAGLAVLLAVQERPGRGQPVALAGVVAIGVTLRSEAALFGIALALACAVVAWLHRERRLALLAAAAFAGAAAGQVLDRVLANLAAAGQGTVTPATSTGSGDFVADRVFSFVLTWLLPSYDGYGIDDLLLAGAALFGILTIVLIRKRPEDTDGIRLFGAMAAACAVARLLVPAGATPGLLVAFPLLAAGLAALDLRRLVRNRAALLAGTTYALFALAVLATQYRDGGSGEWGGRYFLIGLPVIVPVVLAAVADLGGRLDVKARRTLIGAAVVGSLALTASAGLALYDRQWAGQRSADDLEALAADHPDAAVIATDGNIGRRVWRHAVDGDEWFLTDGEGALRDLSTALAAEDRELVVSTLDADTAVEVLEERYEVVERLQPDPDANRELLVATPR